MFLNIHPKNLLKLCLSTVAVGICAPVEDARSDLSPNTSFDLTPRLAPFFKMLDPDNPVSRGMLNRNADNEWEANSLGLFIETTPEGRFRLNQGISSKPMCDFEGGRSDSWLIFREDAYHFRPRHLERRIEFESTLIKCEPTPISQRLYRILVEEFEGYKLTDVGTFDQVCPGMRRSFLKYLYDIFRYPNRRSYFHQKQFDFFSSFLQARDWDNVRPDLPANWNREVDSQQVIYPQNEIKLNWNRDEGILELVYDAHRETVLNQPPNPPAMPPEPNPVVAERGLGNELYKKALPIIALAIFARIVDYIAPQIFMDPSLNCNKLCSYAFFMVPVSYVVCWSYSGHMPTPREGLGVILALISLGFDRLIAIKAPITYQDSYCSVVILVVMRAINTIYQDIRSIIALHEELLPNRPHNIVNVLVDGLAAWRNLPPNPR